MVRIVLILFPIVFFFSCNNGEEESPYEAMLAMPPYSNLTDSIHRDPKNAALYYRRAILLQKNNNVQPALDDLKKAWKLDKKEEYAVSISSILYAKPDSAIAFINSALDKFPKSIV